MLPKELQESQKTQVKKKIMKEEKEWGKLNFIFWVSNPTSKGSKEKNFMDWVGFQSQKWRRKEKNVEEENRMPYVCIYLQENNTLH